MTVILEAEADVTDVVTEDAPEDTGSEEHFLHAEVSPSQAALAYFDDELPPSHGVLASERSKQLARLPANVSTWRCSKECLQNNYVLTFSSISFVLQN